MKRFIVCPNCGAIELAEVIPFHDYPKCTVCDQSLVKSISFLKGEYELAKAISIKQPWAYLICSGIKDIENRTWRTKYRGKVLIHAGAKPDNNWNDKWDWKMTNEALKGIEGKAFEKGMETYSAIIGSVEIVDCVINHESIWAEKTDNCTHPLKCESFKTKNCKIECTYNKKPVYNWVLKNPVLFNKPITGVKGKLSFFIPEIN